MHRNLNLTFNVLSIFVLGTALFVMHPHSDEAVAHWQDGIQTQFKIGFQEVWGDQPYFADVVAIYDGVENFYNQSSDIMLALIQNEELDTDINLVFGKVYENFAYMISEKETPKVAGESDIQIYIDLDKFMSEEPIYDITPVKTAAAETGAVLGWSAPSTEPVNLSNPWFTVLDAYTGQTYCMAIYNGEVNKYLGECKYDYE